MLCQDHAVEPEIDEENLDAGSDCCEDELESSEILQIPEEDLSTPAVKKVTPAKEETIPEKPIEEALFDIFSADAAATDDAVKERKAGVSI